MNSRFSPHRRNVVNFLREKLSKREKSAYWQLSHWVFVIVALSAFAVLAIGLLQVGYTESSQRTVHPTISLTQPRHYSTPTPFPSWDEPTAFVSTSVLRIFDDFVAPENYVLQLQSGDRVRVLAQSADGVWMQVQTVDGFIGWARADHLTMASAAHAPITKAPAPMQPDVLFWDDFQDPESGLSSQVDATGEGYYQNGEYVIRVSSYNQICWNWYPQSYVDCEIEVEARPTVGEGVSYGLSFRFGYNGGYFFEIYDYGEYRLTKIIDGRWIQMTGYDRSDAINQGQQKNRLKVRAVGSQISLYVNDHLLQTLTDTTFDGGQIGLAMWPSGYSVASNQVVEVHFDNLKVRSIAQDIAPTATPQVTPTTISQLEQTPTATATSAPRDMCEYTHRVTQGDDLTVLALAYGVSVKDIKSANDYASDDTILQEGDELCIPAKATTWSMSEMPVDPTPIPGSGCRFMHVFRWWDTPYRITMRYGVSFEALESANEVKSGGDFFSLGEVLCIP
jgi:LysM repeat protein